MPGERSVTVALSGELDLSAYEALSDVLKRSVRDAKDVVVETSCVSFLDSTGLRCLLQLRTACESERRSLTLRNPSDAVRRVLRVSGVEGFFDFQD